MKKYRTIAAAGSMALWLTMTACSINQETTKTYANNRDHEEESVLYREPGDFEQTLWHNDQERSYTIHVPEKTEWEVPIPLVVVLHGATGSSIDMINWGAVGMNEKADKRKFVAVYPDGTGNLEQASFFWNAAHCCGTAYEESVDDTGFLRILVETLVEDLNLDSRKIYVTGFSNGGMMSHRLGAEMPDLFAAVAPVSGTIGGKSASEADEAVIPDPLAPMPIIMFHGQQDLEVPYNGGHIVSRDGREDLSVSVSTSFWVLHNNCNPEPETLAGPDGRYVRDLYRPDANSQGAPVVVYTIPDIAHEWPGQLGDSTATDIILDFLFEHQISN